MITFNLLVEKMSSSNKRKARKYRKTSKYKISIKKKKRCLDKHKYKINKTKDDNTPRVCNSEGKLVKSKFNKKDREMLLKKRKKNKNKVIE